MDVRPIKRDAALAQREACVAESLLRLPPLEYAQLGRPDGTDLGVVVPTAMRRNESLEDPRFVVPTVLQKLVCERQM